MIAKIETPTTRVTSVTTEKKNKRKKKNTKETPNETKEDVIQFGENAALPTKQHVLLCIDALKKILNKQENEQAQEKLFDDGERVLLQITGIKLPKDERKQFIRIELPRCSIPEPRDVCLIVKDFEKGIKADHEPTVNHFNEMLAVNGIDDITQVISLRELKVEYKQYEAKTSLCQKFDIFLVDDRILRMVPKLLGKQFYSKKRIPIGVNLRSPVLKKEITKAINTVTLPLNHHGTCSMVQIGNTNMETLTLADNLVHVNTVLNTRYPGGWKNVRAQHIKTEKSMALPIYANTLPSNTLGFVDADAPKKIKRSNVTDELSTIPGVEVTVTPSGYIKVVKTADPEWDDEKDEAFVDGSEDEAEEEVISEKDKVVEDKKLKKRKKKGEDKEIKTKKSKTNIEPDSEEDDIEDSEKMYMNKIAQIDSEEPCADEKKDNEDETGNEENDEQIQSDEDEQDSNEETDEDDEDEEENVADESDEEGSLDDSKEDSANMESEEIDSDSEGGVQEDSLVQSKEDSDDEEIEEKFDDKQQIGEEDIIVDDDDEEEEYEVTNMNKNLMKKTTQVVDDDEEEVKTEAKHKKRSKKERRNMQKQQKAGAQKASKPMGINKKRK